MLRIAVNYIRTRPLSRLNITAVARRLLLYLQIEEAELSIAFVPPAVSRRLNHLYRGQDYPTDILSFSFPAPPRALNGELIICASVAARQARQLKHSLEREILELITHGLLHLTGYDHERPIDAARLAAKAESLLSHFKK